MPARRAPLASASLVLGLTCALALRPMHAAAQQASPEGAAPQPSEPSGQKAPSAPSVTPMPAQPDPLTLRLREVEREQAEQSTLLPWVVLTTGLVVLVAGTALGVGRVVACESSCPNDFWPGWLVVGGATVSSAGLVWLRLQQEDMADLESRRYHLQNQLDAVRNERVFRQSAARGPSLHLRMTF